MLIQLSRFRLRPGVDEASWLALDREAQAVAHVQPGLVRRTTARSLDGDGGWLVVELWGSAEAADARAADPALDAVDPGSLVVERYTDIGG